MTLTINIKPKGAVRMTRRGMHVKKNAQEYLAYKDEIALYAKKHFLAPHDKPVAVRAKFFYEIPRSWTKREKEMASAGLLRPAVTPDIDNVIKGLFDALNGIAWTDDKLVVEEHSSKWYSNEPRIEVEVRLVEDLF